jgi:hypothetical protein
MLILPSLSPLLSALSPSVLDLSDISKNSVQIHFESGHNHNHGYNFLVSIATSSTSDGYSEDGAKLLSNCDEDCMSSDTGY